MTGEHPIGASEELVYVVDLTTDELDQDRAALEDDASAPPGPRSLPEPPPTPVRVIALLLDGWDLPLLLPIEPTRDVVLLDALARLLRIAVLSGERVPAVAIEYGEALERSLAFERRLPRWVYEGVDRETAARLPEEVRRVLGPRPAR